jgi:NAD+ kinase
MSEGERVDGDDRPSVAVVARHTETAAVAEAVRAAGGLVETGIDTAADADLAVALGTGALADLATADASTPVFPAAAGEIQAGDIARLLDGRYIVRERPLVAVETAGESVHALFDVTLSTTEPATISEFSLDRGDRDSPIARFRADGVAITTPAGSRGYAHAAGGPVVAPDSGVLTVVPISPFATDPDHWILPLSGLSLTVERDDADVELLVDGEVTGTVEPGSAAGLAQAGTLPVVSLPESDRE